jgi:hypothetical protein
MTMNILVDPSQSFLVDEKETTFATPWQPDHPLLVNPSGEFGPDSYIDCAAHTTEKKKKKEPKKKQEGVKKKKANLKLDLSKVKKGMIQTTLDTWLARAKRTPRIRFKECVLVKEILPGTIIMKTIPLQEFSNSESDFALKRKEQKKEMKRNHYWRRQRKNERQVKKTMHILERLQRENSKY